MRPMDPKFGAREGELLDAARRAAFADDLRQARREKGKTQQDLADLMGVTQVTVSSWERGKSAPDIHTVRAIEQRLELEPNRLTTHFGMHFVETGETIKTGTVFEPAVINVMPDPAFPSHRTGEEIDDIWAKAFRLRRSRNMTRTRQRLRRLEQEARAVSRLLQDAERGRRFETYRYRDAERFLDALTNEVIELAMWRAEVTDLLERLEGSGLLDITPIEDLTRPLIDDDPDA